MTLRRMVAASLAILVTLALPPATAADLPGDPEAGRALALQVCGTCHVVAERQPRPGMDGVPSFATLARDPAVTEISLRAFLQTPHARMPDLILTNREIDDIISYILRPRR
jgi:mono/diheme cytochrome c family protein